eukprot:scaffold635_cov535-Prasinococcus_capsulatus_cf.AAC.7
MAQGQVMIGCMDTRRHAGGQDEGSATILTGITFSDLGSATALAVLGQRSGGESQLVLHYL